MTPSIHRGLEWPQCLKRLLDCSLFLVTKFSNFFLFHPPLFIQYSTEECSTVQYKAAGWSGPVMSAAACFLDICYDLRKMIYTQVDSISPLYSHSTMFTHPSRWKEEYNQEAVASTYIEFKRRKCMFKLIVYKLN